jgi:hypothetical protein
LETKADRHGENAHEEGRLEDNLEAKEHLLQPEDGREQSFPRV